MLQETEKLKVVLKGLNGTKHIEKLKDFRKRGWINFAVAFNSDNMETEYHLRRPINNCAP